MDSAEMALYGAENPPEKLPKLPAQYLQEHVGEETVPLQVLINLVQYFEKRAGAEIGQAKSGPKKDREKHRIYAGGWMKAARVMARISHTMLLQTLKDSE